MARLTETDRRALLEASAWTEPDAMRSPRIVEPTPEGRARYVRWASEASRFFKGTKPVRFVGDSWKLWTDTLQGVCRLERCLPIGK